MSMNPPTPPPGGQPPTPPGGQPPGYPPGGPGAPPGYMPFNAMPQGSGGARTNGLAVASLVLGILGIILCFLFIPWILAIIFGAVAIKQCNDDPTYTGKGLAIAGLVCGLVGLGIVVWAFAFGDGYYNYDIGMLIAPR